MFEFNPNRIKEFDAGAENAGKAEKFIQPAAEEVKSAFLSFLKEGGREAVREELRRRHPGTDFFTDFQAHEVAQEMFARYQDARIQSWRSELKTADRTYNDVEGDHAKAIQEDALRTAHEEAKKINANMNSSLGGGSLEKLINATDWKSTKPIGEEIEGIGHLELEPLLQEERVLDLKAVAEEGIEEGQREAREKAEQAQGEDEEDLPKAA